MSKKIRKVFLKKSNSSNYVDKLLKNKANFNLRKSSECTEVILDDTHIVFAPQTNFPKKKVYLFNTVKMQVLKWLKNNDLVLPEIINSIEYNYDYDIEDGILAGTDINHAYWRIAYIKGFINEKTYIAGLDSDCKALRLATLSVLGREKKFDKYKNGQLTNTYISQKENLDLKNVFKFIRLSCFQYMKKASLLLGDDFYSWKTDCIYYRDTEENVNLVQNLFDDNNLTYKQLGY
jgi:hypothetical protein